MFLPFFFFQKGGVCDVRLSMCIFLVTDAFTCFLRLQIYNDPLLKDIPSATRMYDNPCSRQDDPTTSHPSCSRQDAITTSLMTTTTRKRSPTPKPRNKGIKTVCVDTDISSGNSPPTHQRKTTMFTVILATLYHTILRQMSEGSRMYSYAQKFIIEILFGGKMRKLSSSTMK